jgi:flagellar hook-associated protein 1 FlgK
MRSTFGGLNTMVRGLMSSQLSLDTVGHNITNGNTEGYSRQRVNLAATNSQTVYGTYGACQVGTGVDVTSITRARDVFADRQYWQENSNSKYAEARQMTYDKLQAMFNESDDTGLQAVLSGADGFWSKLKTLSDHASTDSVRVVVRDSGKELANTITDDASSLQGLIGDNNSSIELKVESVNQLTSKIYDLNRQIVNFESTGGHANDLRDSRDLMVDKLSALVNVNVTEKDNGSFSIISSGNTLVDEDGALELTTKKTVNAQYGVQDVEIVIKSSGTTYSPTNGELKALQDANVETKQYMGKLATMSAYLLTTFNDAHKAGYGLNDETGHNFFGDDTTNYSSLAYNQATDTWTMNSATVNLTDIFDYLHVNSKFDESGGTALIAAKTKPKSATSGTSTGQDVGSGDNATKLGDLLGNTSSVMLGNNTLTSYYTSVLGKLGVDAQATNRKVTNQETILTQVTSWREGVCGVNTNEELTNMIKFQQGYSAASRCLTTMDEMLDKLINSTGTVGR